MQINKCHHADGKYIVVHRSKVVCLPYFEIFMATSSRIMFGRSDVFCCSCVVVDLNHAVYALCNTKQEGITRSLSPTVRAICFHYLLQIISGCFFQ